MLSYLNLPYNPEKTDVMYVAKGARKIPNIHLQGTTNAYVSKIKFLGKHKESSHVEGSL